MGAKFNYDNVKLHHLKAAKNWRAKHSYDVQEEKEPHSYKASKACREQANRNSHLKLAINGPRNSRADALLKRFD